jgi:hypothetical protein
MKRDLSLLFSNGTPLISPTLEFVFELRATVGQPIEMCSAGSSVRRVVPITGGSFSTPARRHSVALPSSGKKSN